MLHAPAIQNDIKEHQDKGAKKIELTIKESTHKALQHVNNAIRDGGPEASHDALEAIDRILGAAREKITQEQVEAVAEVTKKMSITAAVASSEVSEKDAGKEDKVLKIEEMKAARIASMKAKKFLETSSVEHASGTSVVPDLTPPLKSATNSQHNRSPIG